MTQERATLRLQTVEDVQARGLRVRYRLIGPEKPEGVFGTFAEAEAAATAHYPADTWLEWSNPEPGRHLLWLVHRDEGIKTDTHYRIIED
ncbi:hypothetical protein [Streptomyces sp. CB02488]|uniref:hypothetical protein n=1 Tax=Streptomyces sp. CB02488 TaxID=1703920 RepID=UPI0011613BFE|nr:hypothetical protein [Streptomyces sp. CB02488]